MSFHRGELVYQTLDVDDAQVAEELASFGLIHIPSPGDESSVLSCLQAVADGSPSERRPWHSDYPSTSLAISYVHTHSSKWYGQILRGKFASDARSRLVKTLAQRQVSAFWLDQCLAQRKGDGEAGWALMGLLPYAAMPVLVIGNYKPLRVILESYAQLEHFAGNILNGMVDEIISLVSLSCSEVDNDNLSTCGDKSDDGLLFIDFVEMCRFWPMMERAISMQAKGLSFEKETWDGLKHWITVLRAVLRLIHEKKPASSDPSERHEHMKMVVDDIYTMLQCIVGRSEEADTVQGHGHNVLTALATVTSALGSGGLMGAKLYQPADREALLLAGMCFTLLTVIPKSRNVHMREVSNILNDPYRAFGSLSERIPMTFSKIAQITSSVRILYYRRSVDVADVARAGLADEVTIFSEFDDLVPSEPISRCWNGQWELIPHLSLCMRDNLIDIGERSMNSEPYDDFTLHPTSPLMDIAGKKLRAALFNKPLSERSPLTRMIAVSSYSVIWDLPVEEEEVMKKAGMGKWTTCFLFLGVCDIVNKTFYIEAMIASHMSTTEGAVLSNGLLPEASALTWIRELVRRALCPLNKSTWVEQWLRTNFDGTSPSWYCGVSISLGHFRWLKWHRHLSILRVMPPGLDNNTTVAFVKLSCVAVETMGITPPVELEDIIKVVRGAETISMGAILETPHEYENMVDVHKELHRRTFEIALGALTGIYFLRTKHHGIQVVSSPILKLPAFRLSNDSIMLSTPEMFQHESPFIRGLSIALGDTELEYSEEVFRCLQWDMSDASTFWEAKDAILNTAHFKGFVLTLQLICITTGIGAEVAEGCSSRISSYQPDPAALSGRQVLVYQINNAIKHLCSDQNTPQVTMQVTSRLFEHLVNNGRRYRDVSDWRIATELRRDIMDAITSSGIPSCEGQVERVKALIDMLDVLHEAVRHVRASKIIVNPEQSFSESTMECFSKMLDIGKLHVSADEHIHASSMEDVFGHAVFDDFITRHRMEDSESEEIPQRKLVALLSFVPKK